MSEQTGNATRPSLAVLTNQKQSFDDSLENITSQVHCDAPRYIVVLWRVALGDHKRLFQLDVT